MHGAMCHGGVQRPSTVLSTNRVDPRRLEIREKSRRQDQPLKRLQFPFCSVRVACSRVRYFPLNFHRVSRESALLSNTISIDRWLHLDLFVHTNDLVISFMNL